MPKNTPMQKMHEAASKLHFARNYTVREFAVKARVSYRTAYHYWHIAHANRWGITGLTADGVMIFCARSNRVGHLLEVKE